MIEVLKAFEEGKEIEVRSSNYPEWEKCSNPSWSFATAEYRIKPQPTYIPFTFDDRDLFRDKWIRVKGCMPESKIVDFDTNGICFKGKKFTTYEELFNDFEFIDGSIFGKLK